MQPTQIFISYSRVNSDFVVRLAKDLKASGHDVWLDQLDISPGARWDDELEKALEMCEIFMVILTPSSTSSENVKDEIGYAIDARKRILPVLLESATLPLRLRRFQYVDFTSKSYEDGLESAKQLLRNLIEKPTSSGNGVSPAQQTREKPIRVERNATPMPAAPAPQKKSGSTGLVIGIAAVAVIAVLAVAGIGMIALRGLAPAPPTQTPVIVHPATETPISGPSIIGLWERRSSKSTEHFTLQADGRFSLEARDNETNEIYASASGMFTYDENNIYYETTDFDKKSEPYYLDNGGDSLVIDNRVDMAWTRIK